MKKLSKNFVGVTILVFLCVFCLPSMTNIIKAENNYGGRIMSFDGKCIYYIDYTEDEEGIVKYNLDTKKKTKIASTEEGYGISSFVADLEVKGKYIYTTCILEDTESLSADYCSAIYRFSKDGKKKKLLGYGKNMIIKGKKIYYDKVKEYKKGDHIYTEEYTKSKRYSMNLDGTKKKKVKKSNYKKYKNRSSSLGMWDTIDSVEYGKYWYTVDYKEGFLYKSHKKTKKETVLFTPGKNSQIINYCVSGKYTLVHTVNREKEKSYYQLVSNKSGKATMLEKWDL